MTVLFDSSKYTVLMTHCSARILTYLLQSNSVKFEMKGHEQNYNHLNVCGRSHLGFVGLTYLSLTNSNIIVKGEYVK